MIFRNKKPNHVSVSCGEWNVRSNQERPKHQTRQVNLFTIHPQFNSFDFINDLALVHVHKGFELADLVNRKNLNVAPICLPKFEDHKKKNVGEDCFAMGWDRSLLPNTTGVSHFAPIF